MKGLRCAVLGKQSLAGCSVVKRGAEILPSITSESILFIYIFRFIVVYKNLSIYQNL